MNIIKKNINDILDSSAQHHNFLNNQPYSDNFKVLAKKWSDLPLYTKKDKILEFFNLLDTKQVILLISGTGSGKTVLIPKFVLKYFKTLGITGKIAITNPKTLTTIYNAEYASKTLDVPLGKEVGYRFKGSAIDKISDNSILHYITDGLLLTKILSGDKQLNEYDAVIIDEAHERGIQIDLLLIFIKEILKVRPNFKLIIMSATINPEVFRNYYNNDFKYGEIEISGKPNFPIKETFLDNSVAKKITSENYVNEAVKYCLELFNKNIDDGDIIIFVATSNDCVKGCKMLGELCNKMVKNTKVCDTFFCVEVYSKMRYENKELAVSKDLYKSIDIYKDKTRKIIFATNIAESSITFDGLVHVIDTGYELINSFDPMENTNMIIKQYTTQAQIKQRIGRTGRTNKGFAYHLYTSENFKKMKMFPDPSILQMDITEYVLKFINYADTLHGMRQIISNLITPPTNDTIMATVYKLVFINAVQIKTGNQGRVTTDKIDWSNITEGKISLLGKSLLKFRSVDLLNSLAIIYSHYIKFNNMNITNEIIKLIAILEISEGNLQNLFFYKKKDTKVFIDDMQKYSVTNSDHLTILNIYNNYYLKNMENYLNKKKFISIDKKIIELTRTYESIDLDIYNEINKNYNLIELFSFNSLNDAILFCLSKAYKFNRLKMRDNKTCESKFFLTPNNGICEYLPITKLAQINKNSKIICNEINNVFGKKKFSIISII